MTSYEINLQEMWKTSSKRHFSNSQPEHARAILISFLEHSHKTVNIFCEKFLKEVYGHNSFKEALRGALKRGVKVKMVHQSDSPEVSFSELEDENDFSFLEIRRALGASVSLQVNFATVDTKGFRLETNKDECKALACVNNTEAAKSLDDSFRTIFSHSFA